MSNRLLELQDEFEPPEVAPEVVIEEEAEEEEEEQAHMRSASLGYARLPVAPLGGRRRRRRAAGSAPVRSSGSSSARALAAARPISYRVPGSVPLVAAPGPMNAWAAAVTALLSWRERQVMGVDEALGRLGGRWVDLLHRNQGVPMTEKAALLAAAGLAGDAPVRYSADDFELLLRESGPLWITDDDRGARLFSRRAFIATGITGSHGRDAKLNVIDVMSGRSGAIKLSQLHRRMAGGGRRLQVLHLQQGAPNGPGPEAAAAALGSHAMIAPALLIPLAGLTWAIGSRVISETPDIKVTRAWMDGKKHPGDDVAWDAKGDWKQSIVRVARGGIMNLLRDEQSVAFDVKFLHNGHSIGSIVIDTINPNDAFGWKLAVEQHITIRDDKAIKGADPVVAVEVSFTYWHSKPMGSDVVKHASILLYANGAVEELQSSPAVSQSWTAPPSVGFAVPAAPIIAAVGATWQVVKELFNASSDITITRARLNGKKHPGDDVGWDAKGAWKRESVDVRAGRIENGLADQQSADFKVEFQYNGHSLGNVTVFTTDTNDAWGWKLSVEQDIVIRDDLSTAGDNPVVAAEVVFSYRHSAPLRNDVIKEARLIIYGDGRWTQ